MCGADRLGLSFHRVHPGSPPRVRSRRSPTCRGPCQTGITSACAEQTVRGRPSVRRRRDHLRVCGADAAPPLMPLSFLGSPPRVRSRHLGIELPVFIPGITSACAEQTSYDTIFSNCHKDHLRVCGADRFMLPELYPVMGSPPRVRSRLTQARRLTVPGRITSACAEQTSSAGPKRPCRRDHLRVCGADIPTRSAEHDQGGITSACAEQTACTSCRWCPTRDHLRVCGADEECLARPRATSGSPPRVRGRPIFEPSHRVAARITSACAEQTCVVDIALLLYWDHLRVCGADMASLLAGLSQRGSPPRVRSRRNTESISHVKTGITSACAEQTGEVTGNHRQVEDHLRVCGADPLFSFLSMLKMGSPPRVRSRPATHT